MMWISLVAQRTGAHERKSCTQSFHVFLLFLCKLPLDRQPFLLMEYPEHLERQFQGLRYLH
jgi:hypothetical protein